MKNASVLIVLWAAGLASAVTPDTWDHSTEADFAKGEFQATVVTSLGEIRLARDIEVLMAPDEAPAVVSALAVDGETIYAAAGSEGVVYRIKDGKVERYAETPGAMVASLVWAGRELLAGTGGDTAGIYQIDEQGLVKRIWSDPEVKYVWAIAPGEEGVLYAATGPAGTVYQVHADGKALPVYNAEKLAKNILCLVRSPKGMLYAGTDESGLVIEIDPSKKSSRILLDADEKEIAVVALAGDGGLYAATSDAARAAAEADHRPSNDKAGKADKSIPAGKPTTRPASAAESQSASQPATSPAPESTEPSSRPAAPAPAEIARMMAAVARPATMQGAPSPAEAKRGNAVYYIGPDGLVGTPFRKPVTILAMLLHEGRLILGTGNGGAIYSVTLDGDETAQIADTEAKQVTCLALTDKEGLVFGTANKGSVGMLGEDFAEAGTFTSPALDAKQIARWGTLKVQASVPAKTRMTIATRSGNVAEPQDTTWSDWSAEAPVGGQFLPITSPAGRFLQYRLKLAGGRAVSPAARQVQIIYQVGNLAPEISGVKVTASAKGRDRAGEAQGPKVYRHVKIAAADPNKDKLTLQIEMRELGAEGWVQIAEKLTKPEYFWDTRTVGDGTYELRVTASDSPSNPPGSALAAARISEPVVVDNTSPIVKDLTAKSAAAVQVRGVATDATTRVVSIHYAVDSQEDWTAVLPEDGICDAGSERFTFQIKDLKAGSHRIAVKVEDLYGNIGYAVVAVSVEE